VIGTYPGAGAGPSDFQWYYLAAHHILEGRSPYLATGYLYPAITAFLFTPLASLDYVVARRVWWALSQIFLLAAAWALWKRLGGGWRSGLVIAFVWAGGGAAEESIGLGQIGALLTPIVVIGSFPGRLQTVAVGLGGSMKIIPGVLAVAIGLERKWRSLFWTASLTIMLLGAPWLAVHWFLAGPAAPASTEFLAGTPTILSWSAPSIALRVRQHPGADGKPPVSWVDSNLAAVHLSASDRAVSVAVGAMVMISGLAALGYAARGRLTTQSAPCAAAALIALTLVASPVCWTHYEVLQYPGAAILLDRAFHQRKRTRLCGVLICWALLYTVPVTVLRAAFVAHGGAWPSAPAFLYFWTSISALACLGLFALALRDIR
jgi:hypothetical protein